IQKFMDIRKRAFRFPLLGEKAKFVAIPTTSGTGSEVTPFAVISDRENNMKYPLTDYALTQTIAIVDPSFVMTFPAVLTANTGMDVLTHAMAAYVSTMVNIHADRLTLQVIKLLIDDVAQSLIDGYFDSRQKMHHQSMIARMAFANDFQELPP